MAVLSNPELTRNFRAQLRPGRMLATAGIILALSLTVGYSLSQSYNADSPPGNWGRELFGIAFGAQIVALTFGGGLACLLSINREKELNTFDFQRVTRLTPLELAVGKLLGAPALTYFITLCLLPAAVVGALVGKVRPAYVLAAYAVFLICTVAWHGFALVISLLIERNAAAGGALLFIWMIGMCSFPNFGQLALGQLSPFFAFQLLLPAAWEATSAKPVVGDYRWVDFFFGVPVHHATVLVLLSLAFLAWYLLGVARNIKRDPAAYELFSPAQSLGFAVYLNLLLMGFLQWQTWPPLETQTWLVMVNLGLFFGLGMTVLRNRDRLRRRLNELGERASGWLAAFWPASYVLLGTLAVGLVITFALDAKRVEKAGWEWNLGMALFRVVFLAVWLARDAQFLQWIYLTRIKRPLAMGVLYLFVFYLCAGLVLGTLDLMDSPGSMPFSAIFLPVLAFGLLKPEHWSAHQAWWIMALVAQIPILCVLALFHRQKLQELSARPAVSAAHAD